jgi:glycosyltransferase involved in cell wall biosynthesis
MAATATPARTESALGSAQPHSDESVAIAHDYLTQRGGAERVVLALHRAFPTAPIYTSLFDPEGTFPEFGKIPVHASRLNRVALLRHHHRLALPLLAPTFSSMTVDADVVVCSSSGWAHGVRTEGRKIVYCHAPARWLYQAEAYLRERSYGTRTALRGIRPLLERWDRRAARSADVYVANSTRTQKLIEHVYGIEAQVVNPPVTIDDRGDRQDVADLDAGYFLCVSRLLPYKHVDAVLGAFALLTDQRLVVVGQGPDESRLRKLAPPNVRFIPRVTDDELRSLYDRTRALVAASYEDFGLTPVEAASFGKPTVALRFGGYLDTIVEGVTGLLFDEPIPAAIVGAIGQLDAAQLDPEAIRAHGRTFSAEHFSEGFRALVTDRRRVKRPQ